MKKKLLKFYKFKKYFKKCRKKKFSSFTFESIYYFRVFFFFFFFWGLPHYCQQGSAGGPRAWPDWAWAGRPGAFKKCMPAWCNGPHHRTLPLMGPFHNFDLVQLLNILVVPKPPCFGSEPWVWIFSNVGGKISRIHRKDPSLFLLIQKGENFPLIYFFHKNKNIFYFFPFFCV